MSFWRTSAPLFLCLYVSGAALYSGLFILSANHFAVFQLAKMAVASLYSLVFILPVFLAQSRKPVLRVLGYIILIAYFGYVFFLIGYFDYFGFVPEIYSLGLTNTADLAAVSGHYFRQVFGAREMVLLTSAAMFFALLPRRKLPAKAAFVLILPIALLSVNVIQYGPPAWTKKLDNASMIRRFGLPAFQYLSAREWLTFRDGYLAEDTPFPGKLSRIAYPDAPVADQSAALLPDAVERVILLQIESFDREAIDAELNGLAVMPFVSDLKTTSCRDYTNFHTIKRLGGSSDAEFSVATGRLPSSKTQSIRHADLSRLKTIYDILSENGITPYFAHNNNIGYYGRNLAYAQIPSLDYTFLKPDQDITERDFALQTLSRALHESDRTFYYFFNFQSHGPYRGYAAETRERFGISGLSNLETHYMATMHDVDQTIAALFTLQKPEFDAGENLVILTADHPSYLHTGDDPLSRTRIPMLLCHNSFTGQQIDKLASSVDLFPTILEAFAIPGDEPAIGDSLLRDTSGVVLFPSGQILRRQENKPLATTTCGEICQKYFDYTNQIIRISN